MSSGPNLYYDGYGSYDCPKILLRIKPLKEVKKNTHLENLTTKIMSTESSVHYDGYGCYDCPKKFLPVKPLQESNTTSQCTLLFRFVIL